MSLSRCRFAARSGRPPLACLLGLLLAAVAVLLVPALALAFVSGDSGGCLCQSPQPPGDSLTVVAFLDASHGWLGGGPVLADHRLRLGSRDQRRTDPPGLSPGRSPPSAGRLR